MTRFFVMPKPLQFPTTVKAGATAVKIYRNPLRVPITSGPKANTGAVASYDSYLVVHYRAGKHQRQRFNSANKSCSRSRPAAQ